MAVTDQVNLTLIHNFAAQRRLGLVTRKFGFTALGAPVPRDEHEDSLGEIVCQHCGTPVVVRWGSVSSVRRVQTRWNIVLALCVVIMIASIAFLASQSGKPVPEDVPLSPFFGLSIVGIGVSFVLGGVALAGRRTQRVAVVGPHKAPHSASGHQVPAASSITS